MQRNTRLTQKTGPGKTLKASVFAYVEPTRKRRTNWLPVPILGDEPNVIDGRPSRKLKVKAGIAIPIKFGKKQSELPEAYLQLIARDTSGKTVSFQTAKLTGSAVGNWQELQLTYQAKEQQTVEVSLVNSSARVSAWFDDLVLTQEPPLVVQENHYDPWGLELVGIGERGNPECKWKFQNKELEDALSLFWQDFGARQYDPQLGRWHSVDPAEQFASGYTGMGNNPVILTDPDGRFVPLVIAAAIGIGAIVNVASNWDAIASSPDIWTGLARAGGFAAIGGVSGWVSLYSPAGGAAINGVGNAILGGVIKNQSGGEIFANAVTSGITSAATGYAGAALGQALSPVISKITPNITSPVLRNAVGGVIGGAAVGGLLGGGIGLATGGGWGGAGRGALQGAGRGAATGLVSGVASGFIQAQNASVNPWTGKPKVPMDPVGGVYPNDKGFTAGYMDDDGVIYKADELVQVRHHTSTDGLNGIKSSGTMRQEAKRLA